MKSNGILDIEALSELTNLRTINLSFNLLLDMTPLSGLDRLIEVDLSMNYLGTFPDTWASKGLVKIDLWANDFDDLSSLLVLKKLESLDVSRNPLNWLKVNTVIAELKSQGVNVTSRPVSKVRRGPAERDRLVQKRQLANKRYLSAHSVPSGDIPRLDAEVLDWEVLPPGFWRENEYKEMLKSTLSDDEFDLFYDRLNFIEGYNPLDIYQSLLGYRGYPYYVFLFENHAIAECPMYGNALYVLEGSEDWASVFSLSKRQIIREYGERIKKIRHSYTWKYRLVRYLN